MLLTWKNFSCRGVVPLVGGMGMGSVLATVSDAHGLALLLSQFQGGHCPFRHRRPSVVARIRK